MSPDLKFYPVSVGRILKFLKDPKLIQANLRNLAEKSQNFFQHLTRDFDVLSAVLVSHLIWQNFKKLYQPPYDALLRLSLSVETTKLDVGFYPHWPLSRPFTDLQNFITRGASDISQISLKFGQFLFGACSGIHPNFIWIRIRHLGVVFGVLGSAYV